MGTEWREAVLADLGPIVTGKTPLTSDDANYGGNIPFITPSDMDGRRYIESTARTLTQRGADSVRGARIPAEAVLVSCIGSDMGKAAIAPHPSVTNQQINSVVVEVPNVPLFVYYNLSRRKQEIRQAAGGSAQPIMNKSAFGRLPIRLPPPDTQRTIARILGALDDKIELNREMSATLEAMARALFKSWFVDFDPVRAKAEGRAPNGMDAATAKLFPSELVESELGPIPMGWIPTPVRDAFDITDGKPIAPGDRLRGPHPVYGANGIIGAAANSNVTDQCIVLGKIGTCGSLHWSHEPCWVTNNAFVVLSRTGHLEHVWWMLKGIDFKQYIGGSANPYMPLKNFGHHLVLVPPSSLVHAFEARALALRSRVIQNHREAQALAKVRDELLPRLLSGALDVGSRAAEGGEP